MEEILQWEKNIEALLVNASFMEHKILKHVFVVSGIECALTPHTKGIGLCDADDRDQASVETPGGRRMERQQPYSGPNVGRGEQLPGRLIRRVRKPRPAYYGDPTSREVGKSRGRGSCGRGNRGQTKHKKMNDFGMRVGSSFFLWFSWGTKQSEIHKKNHKGNATGEKPAYREGKKVHLVL